MLFPLSFPAAGKTAGLQESHPAPDGKHLPDKVPGVPKPQEREGSPGR